MLRFEDPAKLKTKKIVFEDVYVGRDSGTLEQLKELSSKRRVIEESINESSFITDAIAREISGGLTSPCEQDLQKLEQYLPLLENLVVHFDLVSNNRQMIVWTTELKIRWTSALSASSFFNLLGPKYFQIDSLRFELCMTLFLYGAILRERALEVLPADLVQSATLFRKAAGVYQYLAHDVIPSLHPASTAERPPESTSAVSSVMSLICLAEAQAVTIRKAEEKGNTGGLLAKLHYGVTQFLDEATGVLYSTTGECKDISSRFLMEWQLVFAIDALPCSTWRLTATLMCFDAAAFALDWFSNNHYMCKQMCIPFGDFISSCKALHELRSQKYLADSLKIAGHVGVAVGVLHHALVNAKKKMPGEESWRVVFRKEIDDAADMLRKYEHENEFVWREKIPTMDELPLLEGKKIVNFIPYHPQRWERALVFNI
ncbi:hypothetical protein CK203_034934 [Vitis vinifera]|uniref:BRO1 domain-containing protein n=1 Tax=Vitis vinifera TaxID=29760 RepID=A0A438FYQ5_VITVI|nr:hypothetical protein CK203_034934 [Vitis vinifera]